MSKKIMIVLLTLALVIGLSASSGFAKTDYMEKLRGASINIVTIPFPQFSAYWDLIPEFEQKYGIKINIDAVPFDQMREKVLLDMNSHTGRFDMLCVDVMWIAQYAIAGYLEPVKKYIDNPDLTEPDFDVDDFLPRTYAGTGVYEDVLYVIPIGQGTMAQEWRTDFAADAGLIYPKRFDGQWTTTKMMEYAKKLHQPDKGIAGFAPMPVRFTWGWNYTQYVYSFTPPDQIGNEFVDKDWKVTINSPAALDALKWYLSLRDVSPEGSASLGYNESLGLFQQGKAAGVPNYNGFTGGFIEDPKVSQAAGKTAHLHTPIGPNGRVDPFFGSWGLGISVDSKNKEAAWVFIQWLTAKKQQLRTVKKGTPPVRHSQFQLPALKELQPWYVELYDFFLNTANPDERIKIPEWGSLGEAMGLYGNQAWTGELSPEKALKKMERDWAKILKRGGYYNPKVKKPVQHWRDLSYYDRLPSKWK